MKAVLPALAIALLATIVIGRTNDEPADGPRRPSWLGGSGCAVEAVAPVRDPRDNRIVGAARYRCGRSGTDLEFTLYLQRRAPNGGWDSVDELPVVNHGSARQRTVTTAGGCMEGVYRTFLRGTATIDGRTRQIEDDSPTVTNPCPNSAR